MINELEIFEKQGNAVVSSRNIAKSFGKQHQHTTQAIENLISENSLVKDMFFKAKYTAENGQTYKEYLMNRDGFSLLVMGFTGKEALNWKLMYIKAFNEMESFIKHKQSQEYKQTRIDSKENQKVAMSIIGKALPKQSYIKPNSIACKAVQIAFGLPTMPKKEDLTANQLIAHALFLNMAVALIASQEVGADLPSISKLVYAKADRYKQLLSLNE